MIRKFLRYVAKRIAAEVRTHLEEGGLEEFLPPVASQGDVYFATKRGSICVLRRSSIDGMEQIICLRRS